MRDQTDLPAHDPSNSAPLLDVDALRKVYAVRGLPDRVAVDGVSFSLARGEALAIVGESGSGKSTIARMVVGLEKPTGGTLTFAARPAGTGKGPTTGKKRLGAARTAQLVFQDPNSSLDPRQSVGAAISEVLRLHAGELAAPAGTKAQRAERVAELLTQVGLRPHHADLRPGALSGGQRQRVAIARALAVEPALLVLDEAVSALDVSVQAQVLNLLADIRAETGVSYLFISHDLDVVKMVCDRVLVMREGAVVEEGSTEAIFHAPAHAYTRMLLDSAPRPGWQPKKIAA